MDTHDTPPIDLVAYCKHCKSIIPLKVSTDAVIKDPQVRTCPVCKETNLPFGTQKSIQSHFRLREEQMKTIPEDKIDN